MDGGVSENCAAAELCGAELRSSVLSLDFCFSGTFVRNWTTPFEYGLMMPGTDCRPIRSEQIKSAMGAGPGGSMVAESDG